jgi:hypothetical protein
MYAQIDGINYPPGWEELEWKLKKLKKFNYSYQLQVSKRAFGYGMGPTYQFTLIRWGRRNLPPSDHELIREVLYEGHDYKAVVGFVSMLLTAEEEKHCHLLKLLS